MSPCGLSHLISRGPACYLVRMEHPINRSIDANENDPSLSVTALIVVLALIFGLYFTARVAVPWASEQAANALSMLW
jgi:hypothetical protein